MGDRGLGLPSPREGGEGGARAPSTNGRPLGPDGAHHEESSYGRFLMLLEDVIGAEEYGDGEYLLAERGEEEEDEEEEDEEEEGEGEEEGMEGDEEGWGGDEEGMERDGEFGESRRGDEGWEGETAGPTARGQVDDSLAQLVYIRTAACQGSAHLGRVRWQRECQVNALHMLHGRETSVSRISRFSRAECCHLAQRYLPTDGPTVLDSMNSRAYIGQFSTDGTIFVAAYQDRRIRLYNVDRGWTLRKDVSARNLRWTVTDTALSPDQRFLVYSTVSPVVHLVSVGSENGRAEEPLANVTDVHEGLNFAASSGRVFGIWSLQFSADGREVLAGGSDNLLHVFDLEARKAVLKLRGHADDVNSAAFAEEASPSHVLFSGSDDATVKVWDRRALERQKPAGVLVGHCEGISHLSSKGDGRHLITNSKDQTLKLWDIRRMQDHTAYSNLPKVRVPEYRWDYRWMDYPGWGRRFQHPQDGSVQTYRGHQVLETLIRCYFSPEHSTGQRYIYSGSKDGIVYIYDQVSGALVTKLSYHRGPVRDCSWHPFLPSLVTTSWDGSLAQWEHLRGEAPPGNNVRPTIPSWTLSPPEELFDSD